MRRIMLVVTVVVFIGACSTAVAAGVDGAFKGKTSQGYAITLEMKRVSSKQWAQLKTKLRYQCPSGTAVKVFTSDTIAEAHGHHRFTDLVAADVFTSNWTWTIKGKKLSGTVRANYLAPQGGRCTTGAVHFKLKR